MSVKTVVLNEGLTVISEGLFYNSTIDTVVVPKSVTLIEDDAFNYSNVRIVYYNGTLEDWEKIEIIENGMFGNGQIKTAVVSCYSETKPTADGCYWRYVAGVPTVWAPTNYSQHSQNLSYKTISEGICYVNGIGNCTDSVISIPPISPDGQLVLGIDDYAFENCSFVTKVILPKCMTLISSYAFSNCVNLEAVVIQNYYYCYIDFYAFSGCDSLKNVYYTGTAEDWAAINIGSSNSYIKNATIHYNYVPEE